MKNNLILFFLLSASLLQAQQKTDALIPYLDGRLYGYCDWDGKVVIKPDYEEAAPFDKDNTAEVVQYGLHGLIDKKGNVVIPPFSVKPLKRQKLYSIDQQNTVPITGLIQYYDISSQKGFIVHSENNDIVHEIHTVKSSIRYSHGGVLSSYDGIAFPYGYKKICFADSTTNVIDTSGQIVFKNNFYNIAIMGTNLFAIEDRQGAVQLIDKKGTLVQPTKYKEVRRVYRQAFYKTVAFEQEGYHNQTGLLDGDGKALLPNAYTDLSHAVDDVFFTRHKDYSFYFVNSKGDSLLTTPYSEVRNLSSTYFGAKDKEDWVLCNQALQPVDDKRFNRIHSNSQGTIAYGSTDNATSFYLPNRAKPLIVEHAECSIHNTKSYQDEMVINAGSNGYHLYDDQGNLLLPEAYSEIRFLGINKSYAIKQEFKRGVFDLEKGWILPLQMWWTFEYQTIDHETQKTEVIFERDGSLFLLKDKYQEEYVGPEINLSRRRTVLKDKKIEYVEDRKGNKYYWTKEGTPILEFAGEYPYFELRSERNRYIIYNVEGERLSPEGYWKNGNCKSFMHDGIAYFELAGENERGVIDQNGKWIIGPVLIDGSAYTRLKIDEHGFVRLRSRHTMELYDLKGNLISRPDQYKITTIHPNVIIVREGQDRNNVSEYAYDRSMNRLIPEAITFTGSTDVGFLVTSGTESILYDFQGKELRRFPVNWIETTTNHPDYWKYKEGNLYGVMTKDGEVVTPPLYKYVSFKKPFLVLQKPDQLSDLMNLDNVVHQVNIKGGLNEFVPLANDHILSSSYAGAYVIDANGKLVSSTDVQAKRLKEENPLSTFCLKARNDQKYFYINMYTGKKYLAE